MFEFAHWLSGTRLSIGIQSLTWLTPTLQAIHILMIGIVFVSMLMIVRRVLGTARDDQTFEEVWARFAPWMWAGVVVMGATGIPLIISEPVRQASATSFWTKLLLIIVAVLCMRALRRSQSRTLARTVVVIWIAIIFLGRAIAYDTDIWRSWSLGA